METEINEKNPNKEADIFRRSKKRAKNRDEPFSCDTSLAPREEEWMTNHVSFREVLMRHNGEFEDDMEEEHEEDGGEDDNNSIGVEGEDEDTRGKKDNQLSIVKEVGPDGRMHFKLSENLKKRLYKPWKQSLIIKLLGKKISLTYMKKRLEAMWAKEGRIRVTDMDNDYFLVRFEKKEDMDFAWTEGPWVILNHYLAVRSWEPNFQPRKAKINHIAAWIRLPDLPMECCNDEVLQKIGNWIGKFIKTDRTTSNYARGKFARLCIEVDLDQPLHAEYVLEGVVRRVEYEALHMICFSCGSYGHRRENCSTSSLAQSHTAEIVQQNAINSETHVPTMPAKPKGEEYGAWMVVTNNRRQRRGQEALPVTVRDERMDRNGKTSRFNALASVTEEEEANGEAFNEQLQRANQAKSITINPVTVTINKAHKEKRDVTLIETETNFKLIGDVMPNHSLPNVEDATKNVSHAKKACAMSTQGKNQKNATSANNLVAATTIQEAVTKDLAQVDAMEVIEGTNEGEEMQEAGYGVIRHPPSPPKPPDPKKSKQVLGSTLDEEMAWAESPNTYISMHSGNAGTQVSCTPKNIV